MNPIIESLLDIDFYKFTMGQIAWNHNTSVRYRFINRTTDVKLGDIIPISELKDQFEYVETLKLSDKEINYLKQQGIFGRKYLRFLKYLALPPLKTVERTSDGQLEIIAEGMWSETIFWETIILSIVNELLYKHTLSKQKYEQSFIEGRHRLEHKIKTIREYDGCIEFTEFGTRRRFSRDWQINIVRQLSCANLGNSIFLGTSNVYCTYIFDVKVTGTFAHELPMIFAGKNCDDDEQLRLSHNKTLQVWEKQYGKPLSIALTDTYGSDFFFDDFTPTQAATWNGLRQDSGDPLTFAQKAISFYKKNEIDPKTKTIIFSDGLNLDKILFLNNELKGQIKTAFGWGTNLTNDMGCNPVSIVVKATKANGNDLVKLSDNLGKALGTPDAIERYKKAFNYNNTFEEAIIY